MRGIVLVGPTASGKSDLAMRLAEELDAEIVSVDSRQVYRRLDIGTAKPPEQDRRRVPHHMIDVLDITEKTDAEWFASGASQAVESIVKRGKSLLLAGGSGLYLRAFLKGFFRLKLNDLERRVLERKLASRSSGELHARLSGVDPESASRIHPNDRYRIVRALEIFELTGTTMSEHIRKQSARPEKDKDEWLRIGLMVEREELRRRIGDRAERMYESGWPEEVEGILEEGFDPGCPGLATLGYEEMVRHVKGLEGKKQTISRIVTRTRQYAKRQMTWFRKDRETQWLDGSSKDLLGAALKVLDRAGGNW